MRNLLMLEDDLERIDRFKRKIASQHPQAELNVYRNAPAFIAAFKKLSGVPDLICLDHDLFTDTEDEPDPGDGRDVARFLASQNPICPALIHSTNAPAADSMLFTMRDAGWNVERIAPIGSDWIEEFWYPEATRMIAPD